MTLYQHTQYLSGKTLFFVAAVLLVVAAAVFTQGVPAFALWIFVGILLLVTQFAMLTVEIDRNELRIRFGIGLIRKRIALEDVAAVGVVTYPWFYGYGIRLTPHGWMYNVSGNEAVELVFHNGKRFRIGSDEPEALIRALPASIARR